MKKKQLLYVHGGGSYSNYVAFLNHLRNAPIDDPLGERPLIWTNSLKEDLGDFFDVYTPTMPNKQNAKYEEWLIWFERYITFLKPNSVLLGWSLGGYFLSKYLSENKFPTSIDSLYLLAAPFWSEDLGEEDCADFSFDHENLVKLEQQVLRIYIFHSKDDHIVSFSHAKKYKEYLKNAKLVEFSDRNHFIQSDFPELISYLKEEINT